VKKWGLVLMLLALLAAPALACGFPLPAGSSMTAMSEAVCADGESAESCQMRADAYQMMSKLQSAAVTDMSMSLVMDDGTAITEMSAAGSFEYQIVGSEMGMGANVHASLTDGTISTNTGEESLAGIEFIVIDDKAYTSKDGGATWVFETLDENALLGLGFLLGLAGPTGMSLDLFTDPAVFTVTIGEDVEMDGQVMRVQTLTLDFEALLANGAALSAMLESSAGMMGEAGVDPSELGDPAQLAMLAPMLMPAFEGTVFSTTLYIGADDGYIHRIEDSYVFTLDSSKIAFGADSGEAPTVMTMIYELSGNLAEFNAPLAIAAPENAQEGTGVLGDEGSLFGGSGLGDNLFGGQ
jgi:hypothetical protein